MKIYTVYGTLKGKVKPSIDEVMVALEWQTTSKQWIKQDGEFIPNPSTYINQGRWMDEAPTEQVPFQGVNDD